MFVIFVCIYIVKEQAYAAAHNFSGLQKAISNFVSVFKTLSANKRVDSYVCAYVRVCFIHPGSHPDSK